MEKNQTSTKKELLWQIYLPLFLFIFVVLAVGIISILSTTDNFARTADWANVSVVFLSVPFMLISLVFLAVFILLIYAQYKLIKWLPIQLKRLYALVLRVSAFVWRISDKAASPIVKVNGWSAAIKQFFQKKR